MRSPKRTLLSLAAGLIVLTGTACADNQEAIILEHVPFWPIVEQDGVAVGACVVDPGTATINLRGELDLAFETPYWMPGVVTNQLLSTAAGSSPSGIDDSEVQLVDAVVKLSTPQDPDIMDGIKAQNKALTNFSVTLQAISVQAGESQGILVEVIPQQTAQALHAAVDAAYAQGTLLEVIAEVTVRARRSASGGKLNLIEARPFTFPIDVGSNWLITCEPCPGYECPPDPVDWLGGVCQNAQDFRMYPIECAAADG